MSVKYLKPMQKNKLSYPINSPWTEKEKKTLLIALRKYGYNDIENISKEFPRRSKLALRKMIDKLRLAARKCPTERKNQIDMWLNSNLFNEDNDTVISQALKFISIFEKHSMLNETETQEFKTLYSILSKATQGISLIDVPQSMCETISYILGQITHKIWPAHENNIYEYIEKLERDKMINNYQFTKRS